MVGINSSLYIGVSGLRSARLGLNTVGNNIANVNTEGYSRQSAVITTAGFASDGQLTFGTGADVASIGAARDKIADQFLTFQQSRQGYTKELSAGLSDVENLLTETSFGGVSKSLSDLFASLEAVTARPSDLSARQELLARGEAVADTIRGRYSDLTDLQSQIDRDVTDQVSHINNLTDSILELNKKIGSTAQPSQDLIDRRYQQINELSGIVGVQVFELANNQVQVNVKDSGLMLVGRDDRTQLSATQDPANNNFLGITYANSSGTVDVTSQITGGSLGAKLQLRDSEIADMRRGLDKLAAGLVVQFNAVHSAGTDLNGSTGLRFFDPVDPTNAGAPAVPTPDQDRYLGAAASIALSSDLYLVAGNAAEGFDPTKLALSSTGSVGDNGVAVQLANLRDASAVIDDDGDGTADSVSFERFYTSEHAQLGRKTRDAEDNYDANRLLLDQAVARRDRTSKVSLDEEAVNLTQFQRAFEANSRFISTINQLAGEIISRLT